MKKTIVDQNLIGHSISNATTHSCASSIVIVMISSSMVNVLIMIWILVRKTEQEMNISWRTKQTTNSIATDFNMNTKKSSRTNFIKEIEYVKRNLQAQHVFDHLDNDFYFHCQSSSKQFFDWFIQSSSSEGRGLSSQVRSVSRLSFSSCLIFFFFQTDAEDLHTTDKWWTWTNDANFNRNETMNSFVIEDRLKFIIILKRWRRFCLNKSIQIQRGRLELFLRLVFMIFEDLLL